MAPAGLTAITPSRAILLNTFSGEVEGYGGVGEVHDHTGVDVGHSDSVTTPALHKNEKVFS